MKLRDNCYKNKELELSYLPADWIFPIQVKSIKVVFLDKLLDVGNELRPRAGAVDKTAVLVPCRVVPTTDGQ